MKKSVFTLLGVMLFSLINVASASFSDVESTSVYYDSVTSLQESGVVEGYDDGTYKPNQEVNRAEFLKMLYEMIGMDDSLVDLPVFNFADVPADEWYTKYVSRAFNEGVIDGYPDGTFRPGNNINLVEAIKIVMNAYFDVDSLYAMEDGPEPCFGVGSSVSDDVLVDSEAWYFKYLKVADDYCILQGAYSAFGMHGIYPDAEITRGDMASLLFRANWVLNNEMKPFEVLPDDGGQVVSVDEIMKLSSPAFNEGEPMGAIYTCDSEDVSPPLTIQGVPEDAVSLALIIVDPDVPNGEWTHLLAWGIDPGIEQIDAGTLPEGIYGFNSGGVQGYSGPCPPSGTHHYNFKLYALDSELDLEADSGRALFDMAIEGHVLATAELTGVYTSNLSIEDFAFSPSDLVVKVGTSLTWTNMDAMAHTVTSSGNFDSGSLSAGEEFTYTFDKAGVFDYICSFHPNMTGTVTVVE